MSRPDRAYVARGASRYLREVKAIEKEIIEEEMKYAEASSAIGGQISESRQGSIFVKFDLAISHTRGVMCVANHALSAPSDVKCKHEGKALPLHPVRGMVLRNQS